MHPSHLKPNGSNGYYNGSKRRVGGSVVSEDMRLSEESLAAFKTLTQGQF